MTETIRGLIFDLDGTLGDTLPVCYEAFRVVFRAHLDREFSDLEIRALFGPSEEGILQRLLPSHDQALDEFLTAYVEAHSQCPAPFPGIPELIAQFSVAGVRLGVVTGKGPQSAAISLKTFGLEGAFSHVEAGSPHGGIKAEAMQAVLNAWGLPSGRVASVGDAVSDIRAARRVGIAPLAAAWASTADASELSAQQPDALFSSVDSFRQWILPRIG